jgi:poly-gamma-glutamate synthase PgsB/CapB
VKLLGGAGRLAHSKLVERFSEHLSRLDSMVRQRAIAAVAARATAELGYDSSPDASLVAALIQAADAAVGALVRLEDMATELAVSYQRASTPAERREVLVRYLTNNVTDAVRLAGDIAATRRWLDLEAIQERITSEIADRADEIEICYSVVRSLGERHAGEPRGLPVAARSISVIIEHAGRARHEAVRSSALRAAAALVGVLPPGERLRALGARQLQPIRRWAQGLGAERWVQVGALELCVRALPEHAAPLLEEQLRQRGKKDGMIARRNALRLAGALELEAARKLKLLLLARDDPSEHVRQQLSKGLAGMREASATAALSQLCLADSSPRVRAVALRELARAALEDDATMAVAVRTLREVLRAPASPLDVRMSLEAVELVCCGSFAKVPALEFTTALADLVRLDSLAAELRDLAASTLRKLEVEASPPMTSLCRLFESELSRLPEGRSRTLKLGKDASARDLERALFVAARGDMAVALRALSRGRYRLTRGEPRRLRLWRLLFELRTPVPDKRKGFFHSRARAFAGEIVVPPRGMAEVTPTRVPGERRLFKPVGGSAPFVPRVDDLLAACRIFGTPVRLVTSFGTVVIRPPAGFFARRLAWWKLTLKYPYYARERERSLDSSEPPGRRHFAEQYRALGFGVELTDTSAEVAGRTFDTRLEFVLRYFSFSALPPQWLDNPISYTLSPSSNMPWHLALVAWLVFAVFILRAAFILGAVERARRAIPLTIGGWGTRGKSGSERLKAALFHALRYDVVVKTTGCEAMFIHARRDVPAREIFLYRPYDKATIWEQRSVLDFGRKLGAQVFLWECMALQPRFVDLLAREWMKDKITTLTNAYPDHEDVMGPSGEDVARVIGRFMPIAGTTFTSEEQMLPLIRDAARQARTRLVEIRPLEADLLPADLLARYPYEEHPRNIALVAELAEYLGVDREFALVMMADYVVPDLGVLKTYPEVSCAGRKMAFSNGMSANERAGFMSNWLRLDFDSHDVDRTPDVVTVAIVNNRADRVPRSRVFAEIFVRDAPVDHIVCIGTNLSGLVQFMEEALELWLPELSVSGEGGRDRANERLEAALRRLKYPLRPGAFEDSLRRMLGVLAMPAADLERLLTSPAVAQALSSAEGLGAAIEQALSGLDVSGEDLRPDVVRHATRLAYRERSVRLARAQIDAALDRGDGEGADQVLRALYRELFMERVSIVERSDASGDQVVDFIARTFAPGHSARLMGCQNIKGTGLDFVYRWLSIDTIFSALRKLRSEPALRAEALAVISGHTDWGLIDCREAVATLTELRDHGGEEWAASRALISALCDRLSALHSAKLTALAATGKKGRLERGLSALEPLLYHWDSVRRRRTATRIMDSVFAGRVGQGRASILMRDLVGREKGGWLAKDTRRWLTARRRS